MNGMMKWGMAALGRYWRRHPLLIFGLLTLLIAFVLWNPPAWPLAAFAILQRHPLSVVVLVCGLAILMLWGFPKWQAVHPTTLPPKERFDRENEARKTLAQILGGAILIVSLLFTWKNLENTQETATKNQERATANLKIAREGQVTDRFTKAIAQLGETGPDKLAVRLGGIYALERIAKDSPTDHWPIMEVLTAYVREHAPWIPQEAQPSVTQSLPSPKADIQAILTVLGRRTITHEQEEQCLNLSKTDLRGADLRRAHLERADLWGAHLEKAWLDGAYLSKGANLRDAHLEEALLIGARLEGGFFRGTRLGNANFKGAILKDADIGNARLEEGAKDLTVKQLCTAKRLNGIKLDQGLDAKVKQERPNLLVQPPEEDGRPRACSENLPPAANTP